MAITLLDLVREIDTLVNDIRAVATNPETSAEDIASRMTKLENKMAEMRNYPDEEWQQARNDIMGLSANLDTMRKTLNDEYEKSRKELTQLSDRAKAQKLYATYNNQPEGEDTPKEDKK